MTSLLMAGAILGNFAAPQGLIFCPVACSRMGSSLLNSISDYLDTGMDECIDQLYDCTTGDGLDDSGEHTDLKNLSNRFSFELR